MTDFDVTGPDNKVYTVSGPEGSTREDALRMAPKLHAAGKLRLKETNEPPPPEETKELSWAQVPLDAVKGAVKGIASGIETFPGAAASALGTVGKMAESILPESASMREEREKRNRFTEENPLPLASSNLPSPQGAIGKTVESVAENVPMAAAAPGRAATRAAMAVGGGAGAEAGGAITGGPGGRFIGGLAGGGVAAGAEGGVQAAARQGRRPGEVAAQDYTRALTRDKDTPEALWQRLEEARRIRPDASIADVGGENVRGLVERIAQTPGVGRTVVVPRITSQQEQQLDRLAGDLRVLGGTEHTARQAIQQTMAEQAEDATPLYRTAYQEGDREIGGSELERLSSAPSVQAAMHTAVSRWRDSAIADGYGAMNPAAIIDRGGLLTFTGKQLPAFPNIQFWDYTKRQLDDMVRSAIKEGSTTRARDLTRITAQLRTALDAQVPSYAEARNSWSGHQSYLDAIEEGANILKRSVTGEQTEAILAGMGESERQGYAIGAVTSIIDRMGGDPAKLGDMTKYIRSPEMRLKISNMLPPEARDSFNQRLNYEIRSSELTQQSLKNSATARRLAEKQDADSLVGELAISTINHGGIGLRMAKEIMTSLQGRYRGLMRSKSDEILAEMLIGPPSSPVSLMQPRPSNPAAAQLPSMAGGQAAQPIELPPVEVSPPVIKYDAKGNPIHP
jgi:hypothetical protein